MSGKFALIIGNTEYTDPGLAQLTAPGKDAEDFARVLKDAEIGAFDDVAILLNQPEYVVREAIDDFFNLKKPEDLLVLYFSGHGVRDELGALYLAVKNTTRSKLRATGIKSDYIREAMDQSRSRRQVLILDCCNSGAFAQGTKAATGASIGTATAFEGGFGRVILTASDSTQFAWEGDKVIGETDNSLFTHYLVEGLEGDADLDGDGRITVDELYDYTYEKVRLATPKQTPSKFSSKQQGEIILRQNMRVEDIKPVSLPDELIEATEDSRAFVRESAVQQLAKLLKGKNLGLARSARETLERIEREDDSIRVRRAATQMLDSIRLAEKMEEERKSTEEISRLLAEQKAKEGRLALKKVETDRKAKEKARRLAAQKAEEERKANQEAEILSKRNIEKPAESKSSTDRSKTKQKVERVTSQTKSKEEQRETKLTADASSAKKLFPSAKNVSTKTVIISLIFILGLLIGYSPIDSFLQLQKPVANVNGVIITTGQWQERVRFQRYNLLKLYELYLSLGISQEQINSSMDSPEEIGQQVLDQMIDESLIREEAKRRGINVSTDEIDKVIQEFYGFYANGTPTTTSLEKTATAENSTSKSPSTPEATATLYTLEGFKTNYTKGLEVWKSYNISEDTILDLVEVQLYRQKLFEIITADAPRTEEQIWARHILVEDGETAQIVLTRLQSGEDFEEVARETSVDSGSAVNGGALGWFGRGVMIKPFEDAAFELKIGEISDPIQSDFGYHIIQVLGHEDRSVDDNRYQTIRETIFTEWLSVVREESSISIDDRWKEIIPVEPSALPTTTATE